MLQPEITLEALEILGARPPAVSNSGPPHNGDAADTQFPMADPGPDWPKPLGENALHGLTGDVARAIAPHSEADVAALVVQFLIGFGSMAGRNAHCLVGADRHYLNLFGVLVGPTAKGRKGSSWNAIQGILQSADEEWAHDRVTSGLSSGEGVIWACRDEIEQQEPIREPKTKRVIGYQSIVTDPGITDKRLMVIEAEFASALKVADRDGNTLSGVIRQCWDTGTLRTMTRNNPARATEAHVSILGHVTKDELLRYLTTTEAGNGFANRFLWSVSVGLSCCRRAARFTRWTLGR